MNIKYQDTHLTVVHAEKAPHTLESFNDYALAVPEMLEWVRRANKEKYDAIILACFSDPGLEAAREQSEILVMGIEETSFHIAAMLGHRFTIITPLARAVSHMYREARRFGMETALASVRALDLTEIDPAGNEEYVRSRILRVAQQAVEEDGAEVIILGCAGLVGYGRAIESKLGIVVIDPVTLAFKICESLAEIPLRHSKKGLYATSLFSVK